MAFLLEVLKILEVEGGHLYQFVVIEQVPQCLDACSQFGRNGLFCVFALQGEVVVGFPQQSGDIFQDLGVAISGEGFVQGQVMKVSVDQLNGFGFYIFQIVHVFFGVARGVLFHGGIGAVELLGFSKGLPPV